MKIKSITRNKLKNEKKFYDITVKGNHNFVINDKSMVVTHNSSLDQAQINLAQSFKNNLPLLEEDGQFGTLRNPIPGAPRYISTKLHDNFRNIYLDNNLLEPQIDEGVKIEPNYLLPIIPMVLVNGGNGIAIGFSCLILTRNPKDIIDNCIKWLDDKKLKSIKPWSKFHNGKWEYDKSNNRWITKADIERDYNNQSITIYNIPPQFTYESFEKSLYDLQQKNFIKDWEDASDENDMKYILRFDKDLSEVSDDEIIKKTKAIQYVTEIFNLIDENNKLINYKGVNEIINSFMDFRLKWYQERKNKKLENLKDNIFRMESLSKFIKLIVDKKININEKQNIIEGIMKKNNIPYIDNGYSYYFSKPISQLTKEKYNELSDKINKEKQQKKELEKKDIKDIFREDLNELKNKLK